MATSQQIAAIQFEGFALLRSPKINRRRGYSPRRSKEVQQLFRLQQADYYRHFPGKFRTYLKHSSHRLGRVAAKVQIEAGLAELEPVTLMPPPRHVTVASVGSEGVVFMVTEEQR